MIRYLLAILTISAACQASFFSQVENKIRNGANHFEKKFLDKHLTLVNLNWKSCGSSRELATIQSLTVHPDPIHIPGNVTVSFSGSLLKTLTSPIEVKLKIEKKELFWVPIPCVDQVGSCDYDDVCQMMTTATCPPELRKYHIPCSCPVTAGKYKIPPVTVPIQSFGIPSWLESGQFKVTAKITNNGREVLCIQLEFGLK